ncbi:DUF5058 family protein [Acidaminobacter hydrogenoformans]|uniref:DUF5058 domain-containing protein n=1 Tax=Acidaminobacter hydrogenoformans DSM 2784 TaxID=1120920 RepID=A0A1G5S1X1_9FIRM|nr:DUF5058 family protein [Acidaminobacter hydrogenoformans]SCZ80374.1 protein of unknown function [Acidaminobacter hydrogenoformans DSM 2784]
MSFLQIANSPILWGITFIAVTLVLFQATIFLKKSYKAGKELGFTKEQLNLAFRTGIIASIGPSMVIVVGMVALLVTVGGPTALMRLAYIGSVSYELMSVGFAADAYGVGRTAAEMTPQVFVTALWCMAIGCIGWVLVTVLFTDKMEIIRDKMAGGESKLIPVISSAAMLGAYGYFNAGYVISMNNNTIAIMTGFFTMLGITLLYRKTKNRILNEWGLTIAMLLGMAFAVIF